ncbi:MAG: helix-turn-helix transcriptional regulator [Bacteriovoracaceae bacterium]|nr:helix-turn-helix transcriptional regulator [Bacteriovoracaceae bacterium]
MNTKNRADKIVEELLGEPVSLCILLQGYMAQHEITQTELARRLGVTRGFVHQLIAKKRFVSLEKAAEIARTLGEPEQMFVKVALQDQVDNAELAYSVEVRKRA